MADHGLTTFGLANVDRPQMPTPSDDARVEHQTSRIRVQLEDWDDLAADWVKIHIGGERSSIWGIPDTSSNAQAELSRQLSTPGLYGKRPVIAHQDNVDAFTGPDGLLDQAGWLSKMAWVQFLTLGISDMFVNVGVDRLGGISIRIVFPTDVYLEPDPDVPDRARALWHLRRRFLRDPEGEGKWIFVWDVYDLGVHAPIVVAGDKAEVIVPARFWVQEAKPRGDTIGLISDSPRKLGNDITHRFFPGLDMSGENYPWRTTGGRALIPFIHYKDIDTGMLWNTTVKRGLYRGTLNSMLYWTYAGHCARDSTGEFVIVTGLHPPPSGAIKMRDSSTQGEDPTWGNRAVMRMTVEPGTVWLAAKKDDEEVTVNVIGAAVNLEQVTNFADRYEMKQATRSGLNPSDLSRTQANPASAAALMVSNEGKRDFSAQAAPIFRRRDLDVIELSSVVARGARLGDFPERGYSIEYKQIPRTPTEQGERREQLTWERDQGLASSLDLYKELHNGTNDEAALLALVRVSEEEALLRNTIETPTTEPTNGELPTL